MGILREVKCDICKKKKIENQVGVYSDGRETLIVCTTCRMNEEGY